jgi:hypothetical protein
MNVKTSPLKKREMKKRSQLVVYLLFMTILISGVLYFGNKSHGPCPVCKHSFASEGMITTPHLAKAF